MVVGTWTFGVRVLGVPVGFLVNQGFRGLGFSLLRSKLF